MVQQSQMTKCNRYSLVHLAVPKMVKNGGTYFQYSVTLSNNNRIFDRPTNDQHIPASHDYYDNDNLLYVSMKEERPLPIIAPSGGRLTFHVFMIMVRKLVMFVCTAPTTQLAVSRSRPSFQVDFRLQWAKISVNILISAIALVIINMFMCTVIPAMVQRLFFDLIKKCDHKYATPSPLPAVAAVKTPVGAVAKNT